MTLGNKSRINLSGSSTDGSVRIYPKDPEDAIKFILSLNNLSLASKTGPAINSRVTSAGSSTGMGGPGGGPWRP